MILLAVAGLFYVIGRVHEGCRKVGTVDLQAELALKDDHEVTVNLTADVQPFVKAMRDVGDAARGLQR